MNDCLISLYSANDIGSATTESAQKVIDHDHGAEAADVANKVGSSIGDAAKSVASVMAVSHNCHSFYLNFRLYTDIHSQTLNTLGTIDLPFALMVDMKATSVPVHGAALAYGLSGTTADESNGEKKAGNQDSENRSGSGSGSGSEFTIVDGDEVKGSHA